MIRLAPRRPVRTTPHTGTAGSKGGIRRRAVLDIAPLTVGVIPFALVIGVAAAESSVDGFVGWLSGPLLAGGSAQLAALHLVDDGAAIGAVLVAVAVINARGMLYSAALAPVFAVQPRWFRWLAPYILVDQMYAVVTSGTTATDSPVVVRRYYLVAGGVLFGVWFATLAAGAVMGPVIPVSWELGFAVPLLFVAMAVPAVNSRPALVAATVAGLVVFGFAWLPSGLGLVAATVAGAVAAALVDGKPAESGWDGGRGVEGPTDG